MAKYRIRVESLDGTEELDERYVNGIECNGFAILGNVDDVKRGVCAIHKLNTIDIAAMMNSCEPFRNAQKLNTVMSLMDQFMGGEEKEPADEKEEFLKRALGSLNVD